MVSKDKKIKRELKKLKKKSKAKPRRKSRATQEIKQIVNLKGLGALKTTQAQPFVFQSQSERPASGTSDFLANAISQLNRVNSPNTNVRDLETNLRRLETELRGQKVKNNQILADRDILQKKYQSIAGQTDGVGDFSLPNKPRNVEKEEEKFQDESTIVPRRGRPKGVPQSQEEKQSRAEQREKRRLIKRLAEKNEGLFESSMTEAEETEDEQEEPPQKESQTELSERKKFIASLKPKLPFVDEE